MSAFRPEKLNEVRDRKHTFFLFGNGLLSRGIKEPDQVQGLPRWYIKVPCPPGPSVYPLYGKQSVFHFPGVPHAQAPSISGSNCMPGSVPGCCSRHFEALGRNAEQCFSYFPG